MRIGRLAIALIAGAIVTVVVYEASLIRQQEESDVAVVVATIDIPARSLLARDIVRQELRPRRLVPHGAITNVGDVQDRIVRDPVYAGEVLIDKRLATRGADLSASLLIPPGKPYAFNLPTSLFFSAPPRLQAHDRIDIIAYPRGRPISEGGPILSNIEILELSPKQTETTTESAFFTIAATTEEIVRILAMRDTNQTLAIALRAVAK